MHKAMPKALSAYAKEWVTNGNITPLDFSLLATLATKKTRLFLLQNPDYILSNRESAHLEEYLTRRASDEPIAYITGKKEFFGKEFLVSKDTLIPRPETECIIEDVLTTYNTAPKKPDFCLDIGTGSGAIAITLQPYFLPSTQVFANDISKEALKIAQQNAKMLDSHVHFLSGSLLEPYKKETLLSTPLFIVANLPYVSPQLFKQTPKSVHQYEPTSALISENEGLAHYYELLQQIKKLSIHGITWLEISPEQSTVLAKYTQAMFPNVKIFIGKDLARKDRFIRIDHT